MLIKQLLCQELILLEQYYSNHIILIIKYLDIFINLSIYKFKH